MKQISRNGGKQGQISDAQLKKELPQRKIVVKSDLSKVIKILKAIPDSPRRAKAHS